MSHEKDEVRLYALQDANWNVVALCDIDGAVLERYTYDGFGKRNTLMNSGIDFDRAFTGQVLDAETGLMCYRNRYYSIALGRFVQRDPIGYRSGDTNLYRYVKNSPAILSDTLGLTDCPSGTWHYYGSCFYAGLLGSYSRCNITAKCDEPRETKTKYYDCTKCGDVTRIEKKVKVYKTFDAIMASCGAGLQTGISYTRSVGGRIHKANNIMDLSLGSGSGDFIFSIGIVLNGGIRAGTTGGEGGIGLGAGIKVGLAYNNTSVYPYKTYDTLDEAPITKKETEIYGDCVAVQEI